MKRFHFFLLLIATIVAVPGYAVAAGADGQAAPVQQASAAQTEKIDINTADKTQLQQVKGIGPKTAGAIVSWRDQQGEFETVDQLLAIKGIGEKTLNNMRGQITVD